MAINIVVSVKCQGGKPESRRWNLEFGRWKKNMFALNSISLLPPSLFSSETGFVSKAS
jgi:hypothetical protein